MLMTRHSGSTPEKEETVIKVEQELTIRARLAAQPMLEVEWKPTILSVIMAQPKWTTPNRIIPRREKTGLEAGQHDHDAVQADHIRPDHHPQEDHEAVDQAQP